MYTIYDRGNARGSFMNAIAAVEATQYMAKHFLPLQDKNDFAHSLEKVSEGTVPYPDGQEFIIKNTP